MDNKSELIKNLESAIDAEHTASVCFKYIASLTKNGRVRAKFSTFVEAAKENKKSLIKYLNSMGVSNFVLGG